MLYTNVYCIYLFTVTKPNRGEMGEINCWRLTSSRSGLPAAVSAKKWYRSISANKRLQTEANMLPPNQIFARDLIEDQLINS